MNDFFLYFFHTILEFLPVSSSFFLSNIHSGKIVLAHAICVIPVVFFYGRDILKLLNYNFILNVFLFGISLGIHFFLGGFLEIINLQNFYFCFLVLIFSNSLLIYRKTPRFFVFLYNFSVFLILLKNIKINNLQIWIDLFANVVFGILLLFSKKKSVESRENYFVLGALIGFTKFLPVSKLGILILYFKYFDEEDYIKKSFIFGAIVNGLCVIQLLLEYFKISGLTNIFIGSDISMNISRWMFFGFTCALFPIYWIFKFSEKNPLFFIYYSVIIRIVMLFFIVFY